MYIEPDFVNEILSYLISQSEIDKIYIKNKKRIIPIIHEEIPCNNNSKSCRMLQNYDFSHIKYIQSLKSGEETAWIHHLSGENIILGIGDSGLDTYHCMFYDEECGTPFDDINMKHRKIVEYVSFMDNKEESYLYIYNLLFNFVICIEMGMEHMFVVLLLDIV